MDDKLPTYFRTNQMTNKTGIAARLLAAGCEDREICDHLNMAKERLDVLKRSKLFQIEVKKARDKFLSTATADTQGRIYNKGPKAVDTVVEVMEDPSQPGPARVMAARVIIDRVAPIKDEMAARGPQVVINISQKELDAIDAVILEAGINGNSNEEMAETVAESDVATDDKDA